LSARKFGGCCIYLIRNKDRGRPNGYPSPIITRENEMRIFERLRRRVRDRTLERKLFETIVAGLVEAMPEEEPVAVRRQGNTGCCCADKPGPQRIG
jgi:hypothetical protein